MTVLNRRVFAVASRHTQEMLETLKAGVAHVVGAPTPRVYQSITGSLGQIVLELEFEDLAHYERFWQAWMAAPETAQVLARLEEYGDPPEVNELWRIR